MDSVAAVSIDDHAYPDCFCARADQIIQGTHGLQHRISRLLNAVAGNVEFIPGRVRVGERSGHDSDVAITGPRILPLAAPAVAPVERAGVVIEPFVGGIDGQCRGREHQTQKGDCYREASPNAQKIPGARGFEGQRAIDRVSAALKVQERSCVHPHAYDGFELKIEVRPHACLRDEIDLSRKVTIDLERCRDGMSTRVIGPDRGGCLRRGANPRHGSRDETQSLVSKTITLQLQHWAIPLSCIDRSESLVISVDNLKTCAPVLPR